MKVEVNHDMCEGHAKCQAIAPDVFQVRDDVSYVIVDDVPAKAESRVERAINMCPRQAIRWRKEG